MSLAVIFGGAFAVAVAPWLFVVIPLCWIAWFVYQYRRDLVEDEQRNNLYLGNHRFVLLEKTVFTNQWRYWFAGPLRLAVTRHFRLEVQGADGVHHRLAIMFSPPHREGERHLHVANDQTVGPDGTATRIGSRSAAELARKYGADHFIPRVAELGFEKTFLHEDREFTGDDLLAALAASELKLPDDFRLFLEEFPETGMLDDGVCFIGGPPCGFVPDGNYPVSGLMALAPEGRRGDDLFRARPYGWERPDHYLVFGDDACGNNYCLDLRSERLGEISWVDHESSDEPTVLAPSFSAFIGGLQSEQELANK